MKNIILAIFCISISFTSFAQSNWKLEKDKDGIKVWTRKQANSNLKEYKGAVVLNVSMDRLITFFKNFNSYEKWMYKADEGSFKLLKKIDDNEFYIRLTMSAPLIKTRESVTHFKINPQDSKGNVYINLETTPDFIPKNDNYVRIPKMSGYWKFVQLGNGNIEVTHQATVAAGGSLPDVMANLGAVDAPFGMLSSIKSMLK